MKILKCIIFALTFAFWLPYANCQPPVASANFVKVEKEITTTPEFQGICNLEIGVVVTINEEFEEYLWYNPIGTSQTSRIPLRGKTVILKETGIWNIVCRYTVNGVECSETRALFVADLKDPTQIQKYFENAGFYAVNISRNPPTGSPSGTQCMPDNISFGSGNKEDLRPIIQSVFDNFKPISSLGGGNIVISENNCLCGEGIAKLEEQFNSGALNVWAHQFFGTADATAGKLFIKGRMPFEDALPILTQKSHLASIHGNILSANGSTTEQGRVIFSNLFMPHPIGGYEPINNCNFSNEITNGSILLSPAAVPISLTSSFSDLRFGHNNDENGAFEGSLTSFSIAGLNYQGYKYLENNFAGYFNEIKGDVIEDFSLITGDVACRGCEIDLPIICNNECFIHEINTEEDYPSSISGGIGLIIRNIDNVPGVTCVAIGCGKFAGEKEIEDLVNSGMILTEEDKSSLRDFFSVMYCEDKEIFDCFREGQLNPGSSIDLFLEDVKDKLLSSPNKLLDGCDDLSPYVDRWTQLGTFNANSINSVKNRLEELGEEYWIQTLENATNAGSFWWKTAPSVNMDFFGLKITNLPNKPYPPFDQFNHSEFLEYIRRNWTSSSFFGDGNNCQGSIPFFKKSFEYAYPQDAFIWTGANGVSTIFTIKMPDDGNVICSQHYSGEYWVFSTLNAPGWLMSDNEPGLNSWDGYHPVSGNRQFGILNNNDGSFTFYTSGVDRLSGWWHATASPLMGIYPPITPGTAFEQADELWTCFLNNVKSFVEQYEGTADVQFDCTTVRPKWAELRNAIKRGCEGLSSSITKFPCNQAKSCE